MSQKIICIENNEDYHNKTKEVLSSILKSKNITKPLVVCDVSFNILPINKDIKSLSADITYFSDFKSNPLYEDVCKGVDLFKLSKSDGIIAIGGGSTIDTAKCIKLFSPMDKDKNYLEQIPIDSQIPLIAIPTTAGTGSESTRFAVIYCKGEKQSITHRSIIPDVALLIPSLLHGLPLYQKKCTMLDALCHGIESWWSINSNKESISYSKLAVETIINSYKPYLLNNDPIASKDILVAANYAGRAINITETTSPHAMSYKLTSIYNLPHGHAAALCLPEVWEYMEYHIENTIDKRGIEYLESIFLDISHSLGCENTIEAINKLRSLLIELDIQYPISKNRKEDLEILTNTVNPVRLRNNPVSLDKSSIHALYEKIVK